MFTLGNQAIKVRAEIMLTGMQEIAMLTYDK